MIYNRIRIMFLDEMFSRDVPPPVNYDQKFVAMGAYYAGFMSHTYGRNNNPAHFYLLDDPSDETIATLLLLNKVEDRIRIIREFKGAPSIEYTLSAILSDVAKILYKDDADSLDLARCWSGVKIMENMIQRVT